MCHGAGPLPVRYGAVCHGAGPLPVRYGAVCHGAGPLPVTHMNACFRRPYFMAAQSNRGRHIRIYTRVRKNYHF